MNYLEPPHRHRRYHTDMYMDIIKIDILRDCGTAGVIVSIDGSGEFVEYLIHGHNWSNDRFDVTRDGWRIQNYPPIEELDTLAKALYDIDTTSQKYIGYHDSKVAIQLSGMVNVFRNWIKAQKDPPTKAIVPPREDVVEIVTTKLANQIAEMMEADVLEKMQCYAIRDGQFIFTPTPEGGFIKLRRNNEAE